MPKAKSKKAGGKKAKGAVSSKTVDLKDLRPGELESFDAQGEKTDADVAASIEDHEARRKYLTSTRFLEEPGTENWRVMHHDQDSTTEDLMESLRRNVGSGGGSGGSGSRLGGLRSALSSAGPTTLLPLAKARVLGLWVAYVGDSASGRGIDVQMELIQLGMGSTPASVATSMTTLGVKLVEQRMLSLCDLEDLKHWRHKLGSQRYSGDSATTANQHQPQLGERRRSPLAEFGQGSRDFAGESLFGSGGNGLLPDPLSVDPSEEEPVHLEMVEDVLVMIEWLRRSLHPAVDPTTEAGNEGDGDDDEVGPDGYGFGGALAGSLREPLLSNSSTQGNKGRGGEDDDSGASEERNHGRRELAAAAEEVEMMSMRKQVTQLADSVEKEGWEYEFDGESEERVTSNGSSNTGGHKDFSHSTARISLPEKSSVDFSVFTAQTVEKTPASSAGGGGRSRAKKGKGKRSGGGGGGGGESNNGDSSSSASSSSSSSSLVIPQAALPPPLHLLPPGPDAPPLRALAVLYRTLTAVEMWNTTEAQHHLSLLRTRQQQETAASHALAASSSSSSSEEEDALSAAVLAASERRPLLGVDNGDDGDDAASGESGHVSKAVLSNQLDEFWAGLGGLGGSPRGSEEVAARAALASAKQAQQNGSGRRHGGGGRDSLEDESEDGLLAEKRIRQEREHKEQRGARELAIKRVVCEEAVHLLSLPEACLLTCWLGYEPDEDRAGSVSNLIAALEQVEAWSGEILKHVTTPGSPFCDQQSKVCMVMKSAYWQLVKLHEARGDSSQALAVLEQLRNSCLVNFRAEETEAVNKQARQCRWSELKERGDELFYEGQYTACRALHAQAVADPDRFIFNVNQQQVSEQMIKNCDHKAKHETKIFAKAKAGAARSKLAREQQQAREQNAVAQLGSKHRQAQTTASAGGGGGESENGARSGEDGGAGGGSDPAGGLRRTLFDMGGGGSQDVDRHGTADAQLPQLPSHNVDAEGNVRSDPSVNGLVEFALSLSDQDFRSILALTDGPTAVANAKVAQAEAAQAKAQALAAASSSSTLPSSMPTSNSSSLGASSTGKSSTLVAATGAGGGTEKAFSSSTATAATAAAAGLLIPGRSSSGSIPGEEEEAAAEASARLLSEGAQDLAAAAEAGRFLVAAEGLHQGVEGLHSLLDAGGVGARLAPLGPSKNLESFSCQLREAWPCQQSVTEFATGQPTRHQVNECLTCRGAKGGGGRLHLVCDFCMWINHRHFGHEVRPMGSSSTCDDRGRPSPWCPILRIQPLGAPPILEANKEDDSSGGGAATAKPSALASPSSLVSPEADHGSAASPATLVSPEVDDLMAELAASSANALLSSPGGATSNQLAVVGASSSTNAAPSLQAPMPSHFLRCVLCANPEEKDSGVSSSGGGGGGKGKEEANGHSNGHSNGNSNKVPSSYYGSSLGGGRDVVFPSELTADQGGGWVVELEMPQADDSAEPWSKNGNGSSSGSSKGSGAAAKQAWVKQMLQKARFPHSLLKCVENSKFERMEKLHKFIVTRRHTLTKTEAELAKAERAASLAADLLGTVDDDGDDDGAGGARTSATAAAPSAARTPKKEKKKKDQKKEEPTTAAVARESGSGRPLTPLDMVCYFCLRKREKGGGGGGGSSSKGPDTGGGDSKSAIDDAADCEDSSAGFQRCLGLDGCGRTFCGDCISLHEHLPFPEEDGFGDDEGIGGGGDEEGGEGGGGGTKTGSSEGEDADDDAEDESGVNGGGEVKDGKGEARLGGAGKEDGAEGETKAVSMHRLVANAHAWAAGRGEGEEGGGGSRRAPDFESTFGVSGEKEEEEEEEEEELEEVVDVFGSGFGLRRRKNARQAGRNARQVAQLSKPKWTSTVAPASGSEGEDDCFGQVGGVDEEEGGGREYDVESGLAASGQRHQSRQQQQQQQQRQGGGGMSEIERDVVRLRKRRDSEHEDLANNLLDMHVDLWLLRSLYQQVAVAALAHRFRFKLERAKDERTEAARLAVSRALEQDAEEAMRQMLLLEEVEANSSSSRKQHSGSGSGGGGGGGQKGSKVGGQREGGASGGSGRGDDTAGGEDGVAKKALTKKQKEKEKARGKREAEAKAAAGQEEKSRLKREAHEQAQRDERRSALVKEKELHKQARDQQEQQRAAESVEAEAVARDEEERMVCEAVKASEEELLLQQRVLAEDMEVQQRKRKAALAAAADQAAKEKAKAAEDRERAANQRAASAAQDAGTAAAAKAAAAAVAAAVAAGIESVPVDAHAVEKGKPTTASAKRQQQPQKGKEVEGGGGEAQARKATRIARAAQQQQDKAARAAAAVRAAANTASTSEVAAKRRVHGKYGSTAPKAVAAASVAAAKTEPAVEAVEEVEVEEEEEEEENGFVVQFGIGSDEDEEEEEEGEKEEEVEKCDTDSAGQPPAQPLPPSTQKQKQQQQVKDPQPPPKLRPTAMAFMPVNVPFGYGLMPASVMMAPAYMGMGPGPGPGLGGPPHMMHPHAHGMMPPPPMMPSAYFVPPPPGPGPGGGGCGSGGDDGGGEEEKAVQAASAGGAGMSGGVAQGGGGGENNAAAAEQHAAAMANAAAWQQWQWHQMYLQQQQQHHHAMYQHPDYSSNGMPTPPLGAVPPEVLAQHQQHYQQQLYEQQQQQQQQQMVGGPPPLPQRLGGPGEKPAGSKKQQAAAAAAAAAEHASALVSAEWPAINPAARRGVGEMATAQDGDDEVEEVEEEEERTEEDLAASALRRALQIDSPARPKKVATPKGGSVVRATGPTTSSNSLHPPSSTPSSSSVLSSLSPPALAAAAGEDAAVDTLLGLDVAPWLSREYAAALLHLARSPLLSANSPASASSPASPVSSGVNTARDVQAACDLLYDDSSGDLRERLDRIILLGSSSSSGSSSSGRSSGSGSSGAESLVGIVDSSSSCPGSPPRGNASSPAPAGTNSQKRDKKSKPRGVKNQPPSPSPPPQPSSLDAGAASSSSGSREKGGKGKGKGSGGGGGKSVHGKGGKGGASGARR